MGAERTSYCVACDLVVTWKTWGVWQRHVQSPGHRESLVAPKPLPPERVRPADVDDRLYGLAEGESGVFRRPDGPWIGLANLGGGASLRIEAPQLGIALERLERRLGPDAPPPKRICVRCRLILDPVIMSHHVTGKEHRANGDPWVEDLSAVVEPVAPAATLPATGSSDRFSVSMEPLLVSVADAARVLGLSKSTIHGLAANGTIPSLRIGTRVLLPVQALQEWIEARLVEDQQRYAAPWSSLHAYTSQPAGPPRRRRSWGSRP